MLAQPEIDLSVIADNILEGYSMEDVECFLSDVNYYDYADKPVEFCEEILKQQLTEDVKRMLWTMFENPVTVAISANAVGKTHGAACAAIWFKKCRVGAQVVLATAPPADRNLKAKLWGEIRMQIVQNPEVFETDKINSLYLEDGFDPKSYIQGVTIPMSGSVDEREAKFSGMHAPNLLFVLDEGDAIPDEVYRAIESCMSGGFARLLVMFNPKRRLGAVYRKIRDGQCATVYMRAFDHPNVTSGKDIIQGAVTRGQTIKRIHEWTVPLTEDEDPDGTCYEVPEFLIGKTAKNDRGDVFPPLEGGWRRIMEPQFAYMVLGSYPLQSMYQLISVEWIDDARARWDAYVAEFGQLPPIGVKPIAGMDAADLGEDYNTLCFRYGGWVDILKRWHGMDIQQSSKKASLFYHEKDCRVINVDATGVGAGIAPNMNLTCRFMCPECKGMVLDPELNPKEAPNCPYCLKEDEVTIQMNTHFCNAQRIMVASKPTEKTEMGEFGVLRDQLWWAVREWLRIDKGAMLPPNERLIEELSVPEYQIMNGKIKIMGKDQMRKELGRSPDDADALCLTFSQGTGRPKARLL